MAEHALLLVVRRRDESFMEPCYFQTYGSTHRAEIYQTRAERNVRTREAVRALKPTPKLISGCVIGWQQGGLRCDSIEGFQAIRSRPQSDLLPSYALVTYSTITPGSFSCDIINSIGTAGGHVYDSITNLQMLGTVTEPLQPAGKFATASPTDRC